MLKLELLARNAIQSTVSGNEDSATDFLVDLFNEANRNPEQLAHVQSHAEIGNAFLLMLVDGISSDDDSLQQIASISYLFLTKAYERNPQDINLVKNRVLLMNNCQQHLVWTVISALGSATSAQSVLGHMSPMSAKGMIYKMVLSDLESSPILMTVKQFMDIKAHVYSMINDGAFGPSATRQTLSKEGYEAHKKLLYYLHNKIVNESDVEF